MARTIKNKSRKTRKSRKKNRTNKNMRKIKGGASFSGGASLSSKAMRRRDSIYLTENNKNRFDHPVDRGTRQRIAEPRANSRGAEEPNAHAQEETNNHTQPLSRRKSQIFEESGGTLSHSQVDINAYDKPYEKEVELIRRTSSVKIETDKIDILTGKGITMIYDENARRHNFYIEGRHIGFADCCFKNGKFFINTIYINVNERGKSYGKTILKYLIESAFDNLHATVISLTDETAGVQYNPNGRPRPNAMYSKAYFVYTHPRDHPYFGNDMILTQGRYNGNKSKINEYLDS